MELVAGAGKEATVLWYGLYSDTVKAGMVKGVAGNSE